MHKNIFKISLSDLFKYLIIREIRNITYIISLLSRINLNDLIDFILVNSPKNVKEVNHV